MKIYTLLLAMLLSGCATYIENRVACTVDHQEAHFISKWGAFSIGSKIAAVDATVICQGKN